MVDLDNMIMQWDTTDIISTEIQRRMVEDEETINRIRRLKRRVYKDELPVLVENKLKLAKENIKKGFKIPDKFKNPDGSLNEEYSRKDLKKKERANLRANIMKQVEDELFSDVCNDSCLMEMEWDSLTEYLSEVMKGLPNHTEYWKAKVTNFGWRNLNGEKSFHADNGLKLLQEILPDTDCTFKIFKLEDGSGIALQNWHHDSPMGNEWYVIRPCPEDEEE